ncbi:MAG: undecaprenyl diphosphate synthase family protein [Spirochaetia bacterium]
MPHDHPELPTHVGIIMDGNGRWAKARGKPRTEGHVEGAKAAKRVVTAAVQAGLAYLSLYIFSTENWSRAEEEVSYLMFLVRSYLRKEYDFYRARTAFGSCTAETSNACSRISSGRSGT